MTGDSSDSRDHGVEFGPLTAELEAASYPLSHEELLREFGSRELDLVDGTTTVSEALGRDLERTYESPESVHETILAMVGSDAVGREDYSDRGGNPSGVNTEESESL